jgi:chemotaxis protein CheX
VTTDVLLDHDDIVAIVEEVWTSFLGEDTGAEPRLVGWDRQAADAVAAEMTGSVKISGAWNGSVSLGFPVRLAAAAAGAMFMSEPGDLKDDDICDAVGELTNMVGGTIKSTVPAPSVLSIPTVTSGTGYHLHVADAARVADIVLSWRGDFFTISIWEG